MTTLMSVPAPIPSAYQPESDILRTVLPWSIGLIIAVCLLVGLRSTVLTWMLP